MATLLTLGGIVFADFEIPERVNFGGDQMLIRHKLGAGKRIIDAMGPDDDDPKWSGRFRGPDAETRARQLDLLRKQGQPLLLTYSSLRYTVLIASFKPEFERPNEIPYSITLCVVSDDSSPVLTPSPDTDQAVDDDMTTLDGLATSLGISDISDAVTTLQTAAGQVASLPGATGPQVAAVQLAIGNAQGAVNTAITAQNGLVAASGTVAGMTAGGDPVALSTSLLSQASAFQQLGTLYQAKGSLGRMLANVTNAGI